MKKILLAVILCLCALTTSAQTWIRINQVGYLPNDKKVAVLISTGETNGEFSVFSAIDDKLVFSGKGQQADPSKWALGSAWRFDFTPVQQSGGFYISSNGVKSPIFRIGSDVYDGIADYLLIYMRQQQCGYNPYTDTECHQHDGYILYHPTKEGQHIDVTGGWHDAADLLQYMTTSSTSTYQMAFAYKYTQDKSIFKDCYDDMGRKGANGIPDIIDQVKWGLDWVDKMNPAPREMYYQIADDRDHAGMRYPKDDQVDYGYGPGLGRPVYFVSGEPQVAGRKWGLMNRTTGVSSAAGKFASTFALGADVIRPWYPDFAAKIEGKVKDAYDFALEKPGNTQTACVVSKYFYEEDTWVDDIELAAATMYSLNGEDYWKKQAAYWGELEPVTPWMEKGRGPGKQYHHYQWYPFINLGHYLLANSSDTEISKEFSGYMKQGLLDMQQRAGNEPFMHGVPYLWCSNNLTSAAVTQAQLYRKATGDTSFVEMETALRDWLLGCNPWGTTMICGLPDTPMEGYDYPRWPQSSYTSLDGKTTYGGLIDGPIYNILFQERAGGVLKNGDPFEALNKGIAVYHDTVQDYASNEPTLDGTAGLTYYFASLEQEGRLQKKEQAVKDKYGAITKLNPDKRNVYFLFSSDGNMNGADEILKTLKDKKVKGNFFVTGNHLRDPKLAKVTKRIIKEGHYLGGHSDKHERYTSPAQITSDLKANYTELAKFGVTLQDAPYFLPPFEECDSLSVGVLDAMGVKVINLTPGTGTNADYMTADMRGYKTAQQLLDRFYAFEKKNGLDGAIILIHPGIHPNRPDSERLSSHLGEMIDYLTQKGYNISRL